MSKFPFQHIERPDKAYRITFLESVSLQISYDSSKETFEKFKAFFEDYTGGLVIDNNRYTEKKISSLRIKSDGGLVSLKFARDFVDFTVDGSRYIRFDEIFKPFLASFSRFLESIESIVKELSLEKVNIWPVSPEQNKNLAQIVDAIFSKEIQTEIPLEFGKMSSRLYESSDDESVILIKYGLMAEKDSEEYPKLVLDTKCVTVNAFESCLLEKNASYNNQNLYDAYRWAVTEKVIKAMDA